MTTIEEFLLSIISLPVEQENPFALNQESFCS